MLVRDGAGSSRRVQDPEGFSAGARQFDSDITAGRYPRAALGIADGTLIAAVCDGRTDDDAGLTLDELAEAMIDLGATDAINLDGGGSASLVIGGILRNRRARSTGSTSPTAGQCRPRWPSSSADPSHDVNPNGVASTM